ncbi:MAG: glycosyltransferase family 1 protein [Rikenellaceae bacterium]
MKLAYDAYHVFGDHSGLGNYGRSTIELMSKYYPDNDYSILSAYDKNRVNFSIPKNVKIVQPRNFLGSLSPAIWRNLNMSNDIRRSRAEIFHGLNNILPLDIRYGGAKSVVTMHDLIFLRYPNLYPRLSKAYYNWMYKKSCENADLIIAISQQTKQDLVEFYKLQEEKIAVVHQGCNPIYRSNVNDEVAQRVKRRYNLPDRYIVSVGTIEERKNLMLTLHAIGEGELDIPLVACGKWTPYVDKLKEYAQSKGIMDKVIFLHNCHLEELPSIYKQAAVSVYVSLFEGFGLPIIESMSCGTPVITSTGGVFSEAGGDAALYVGQYDLDDLTQMIKKIISSDSYRAEIVEKGYKNIAKFDDDKIADNLMAVYQRML